MTELEKNLTHRVVPAKNDVVVAKQNPAKATWGRDSLAKVSHTHTVPIILAPIAFFVFFSLHLSFYNGIYNLMIIV